MAKIALQLYTIKEETQKDFLGTLGRVARIGYDGVEFAGYFETPASVLAQRLKDLKLEPAGTHIGIAKLESELPFALTYCQQIGCKTICCPGIFENTDKESTFFKAAELFNHVGEVCQRNGLAFQYHIHSHEFTNFNGRTGMDILLAHTAPELVSLQLDTYWIDAAGLDAVEYLKAHQDRIKSIHFKDLKDRQERRDTEVGQGLIDVPGLIAAAQQVDWFIVEQEKFDMPQMDSIAISLQNLRKLAATS